MSTTIPGGMRQPTELTELRLTVSQVCRAYPGCRGKPSLSPSTVTRWILRGCPSLSGERVKLSATRVGGRWLIDPANLQAFFTALGSIRSCCDPPAPSALTGGSRERVAAGKRAADELKRRGA